MKLNFFCHFRACSFKNMLQNFCGDILKIVKNTDNFVRPRHEGSLIAPPAEISSAV